MTPIMKTGWLMGWTVLALMLACSSAQAYGEPLQMDAGFYFKIDCGGCKPNLGPWYAYFPYEAYFQTPAPVGPFPHWNVNPSQGVAPVPPANAPLPPPQERPNQAFQGSNLQPVGYYHRQPAPSYPSYYYLGNGAPSYWYER